VDPLVRDNSNPHEARVHYAPLVRDTRNAPHRLERESVVRL